MGNPAIKALLTILFLTLGACIGQFIAGSVWEASGSGAALRILAFLSASGFPLIAMGVRGRRRDRRQEEHRAATLAKGLRNGALDYWVFQHPLLPAPEEPQTL